MSSGLPIRSSIRRSEFGKLNLEFPACLQHFLVVVDVLLVPKRVRVPVDQTGSPEDFGLRERLPTRNAMFAGKLEL